MKFKIIVLTKNSSGNETVGDIHTIARTFDEETQLGEVYDKMKELGSWDIIIPRSQGEVIK